MESALPHYLSQWDRGKVDAARRSRRRSLLNHEFPKRFCPMRGCGRELTATTVSQRRDVHLVRIG
jgi:hypothetical protein